MFLLVEGISLEEQEETKIYTYLLAQSLAGMYI